MADTMLALEMKRHLRCRHLVLQVATNLVPVFKEHCKCAGREKERSELAACQQEHGMTEDTVRMLVEAACSVFCACDKLHIDTGQINLSDYYFLREKEQKAATSSVRVVIHIKCPSVLVHLVNCPCVDLILEGLREAPSTSPAIVEAETSNTEHGPVWQRTRPHIFKSPRLQYAKRLLMSSESNTTRCLNVGSMWNLRTLMQRVLDDDRIFYTNKAGLMNTSTSQITASLADPLENLTVTYVKPPNHCTKEHLAIDILRCLENGLSADCVVSSLGIHVDEDKMVECFETWCNCPCDMKVYMPNTLDISAVNVCMASAYSKSYISSEMTGGDNIGCQGPLTVSIGLCCKQLGGTAAPANTRFKDHHSIIDDYASLFDAENVAPSDNTLQESVCGSDHQIACPHVNI